MNEMQWAKAAPTALRVDLAFAAAQAQHAAMANPSQWGTAAEESEEEDNRPTQPVQDTVHDTLNGTAHDTLHNTYFA